MADATIEQLKQLVRKHKVCYEVWPEYLMVQGQCATVGFHLDLSGTHADHEGGVSPGCHECQQVYDDLKPIATWILPNEERDSYYDIRPFDRSIYYAPTRKFRKEVTLSIKILHRHGFDQPVDKCEEICLKEMKSKLAELGIKEGVWKPDALQDHASEKR
jgi:hypothetical protein